MKTISIKSKAQILYQTLNTKHNLKKLTFT